ncbi:GNAT family N-acetyltransferase [Streptomyces sp. NPDC006367]|uniref:GNAT family N-acetyltransferase n=1 Tax=unclassified Streptomyces TaxID=2593676 RepID=UPI0033BA4570
MRPTAPSGPAVPSVRTQDRPPAELLAAPCRFSALSLAPRRLLTAADDARWETRWTVARIDGRPVGAVTSHRPATARFTGGPYELTKLGDVLGRPAPEDPRRWVFVGGCRDLAAGALTDSTLSEDEMAQVRGALAAHAFAEADAAGDFPVALHVRADEAAAFTAGIGPCAVARELNRTADLFLTGNDVEEHTAALSASQRERCRKDRRRFAALGHTARRVPAETVLAEAAPLVCAVKTKYGVADHPRLALFRLQEWVRAFGTGDCHASVVRDSGGRLLAVSFFAVQGEALEGYEIGLADDVEGREYAYLQAMIHGPVQYAFELGCRRIDLGLDSSVVKQRRGAVISGVWAISLAPAADIAPVPADAPTPAA